uniref:Uncharacterized protein n=1 Tax=viral metagenome TaxID=1070528 RepID=A0A6C0LXZ9_9ZZZZ
MSGTTTCILIDKKSTLTEYNIKNFNIDNLYKKCGFKSTNDFMCRATWEITLYDELHKVYLYGKKIGRAGSENKYDFPPPVDNELFFGTMIMVMENQSQEYVNLTLEQWAQIYNDLFGGFDDIGSEDENEIDELENVPQELKTKQGYLKDDFVVDDILEESGSSEFVEEDEEGEYEYEEGEDEDEDEDEDEYSSEVDSELSEECYIYSGDEDN